MLEDGRVVKGDFLVAADGANSKIRQTMFSEFEPILRGIATFQIMLPLEQVHSDSVMRALIMDKDVHIMVGPGRSIFMSPTPHQGVFDLQFTDHEYLFFEDPSPAKTN